MKFIQTISNLFNRQAIVLMYHRIADVNMDPWQLAVSPRNFEEQLQVLQKKYKVAGGNELTQQLYSKNITSQAVYLTFDDGYSDNFLHARPLLEKYSVPASFFIPSQYIDKNSQFWWDELEAILLITPKLPSTLSLLIDGEDCLFHLSGEVFTDKQLQQHQLWMWPDPPPTDRCALYLNLWERLKPLPYAAIQQVLNSIKDWAGYTPAENTANMPMAGEQLQTMAAHPLFTIGMHTITHPALAFHPYKTQLEEIAGNRNWIEGFINKKVEVIAYPYGNYNDVTINVLKEQHIMAGFTTEAKLINNNSNPYRLGRFQVNNWDGETFERQLYYWIKGL